MSAEGRTYRFLVTDAGNPEEPPRELFLTVPERDDLSYGHVASLIEAVGVSIRSWYRETHGFEQPAIQAGTVVDLEGE